MSASLETSRGIGAPLQALQALDACEQVREVLRHQLPGTVAFADVLASLRMRMRMNPLRALRETVRCLRAAPEHDRLWRAFAVSAAARVRAQLSCEVSLAALALAERHVRGDASDESLAAMRALAPLNAQRAADFAARATCHERGWQAAEDVAWAAPMALAWSRRGTGRAVRDDVFSAHEAGEDLARLLLDVLRRGAERASAGDDPSDNPQRLQSKETAA